MKTEKTLTVLRKVLKALILIIVGAILLANLYCLAAREIFGVKAPTVFGCSSAVVLTGSKSMLGYMVNNNQLSERYSALDERLAAAERVLCDES